MGLTVVDAWSPRCGPCRMMDIILGEIKNEYKQVKFTKVNVDEKPDFAQRYFIFGIPTLLFLKDGKEVDRIIGVVPVEFIRQKINRWLASN